MKAIRGQICVWTVAFCTLALSTMPPPASASSLLVPDQAATIQDALNAVPDTVLVRSGTYPDTVTITQQVVLASWADSGQAVASIAGISIEPLDLGFNPTFICQGIRCTGPLYVRNDYVLCAITLKRCQLDAGLHDLSRYVSTARLELLQCLITGASSIVVDGYCLLDSCVINGTVSAGAGDCRLSVQYCTFTGAGFGAALGYEGSWWSCQIHDNIFRGYRYGVLARVSDTATISNNVADDCSFTGFSVSGGAIFVSHNVARRCGEGIYADPSDSMAITANRVEAASQYGLYLITNEAAVVDSNVVWLSSWDGIVVGATHAQVRITNNTSCFNGRSGIGATGDAPTQGAIYFELERNIALGNGEYGVRWGSPDATSVACNDLFGNSQGPESGRTPSSQDLALDPVFCDTPNGDFHLAAGSPLLTQSVCGVIGALGTGCRDTVTTATLVSRFTAERKPDGIRVVWELADGGAIPSVRLERGVSEGGPWIVPATIRSLVGHAIVELDTTAPTDQVCWYRLAMREGQSVVALGASVMVPAGASTFALTRISPNPGGGPVDLEFTLARSAVVELDVFDVQGRVAAVIFHGALTAGQHRVRWTATSGNRVLPSGLYLLRYKFPNGQQTRRMVRSR